jgi:tetratricopeptide (TPR) repeat protein
MVLSRRAIVIGYVVAFFIPWPMAGYVSGQAVGGASTLTYSGADSLGLAPAMTSQLEQALKSHDYVAAEKLLLPQIEQDPHSAHAAQLLAFLGGVYFLDRDYLHAAVAWKKSEAIAPLQTPVQFSLAMAYVQLGRPDWARGVLDSLAKQNPKDALYPYWLGRLDFAAHSYGDAILHFKNAIGLAPGMAQAYDNLGLCYYHLNQNDLAVQSFTKAIDLDRTRPHPSAWPYLNLAVTLRLLNRPADAEANLQEAILLDPKFAQAHFQMGAVLEEMGQPKAAIGELREAALLEPGYAEPHFVLARIYRKLGQEAAARKEVQTYLSLRAKSGSGVPPVENEPLP